ncbi:MULTISPECIES: hypothetical protein [Fusobacterium]|jgi:hypothetical protein|uniref:Toxin-antitoxin system, antitoxin component, ribbon-helix-helix domain protein n=1 Tax=Fusobacterium varium ATCC 27725 TaxID=469618 RepID=A0ABN5JH51_FUSVA|nr:MULTISPECIES: hypothetical protein [Fusobacterium]AVQ31182.1 hypothetical protein C4N18_08120 [Fusobacterium varium ATCC 27725]EES62496.2 hypothetical protein FVAG_00185 [Fusobacterium varium ATCC 27725]MCD7980567.1 hypothetical protein [Fusobacterium sp.]MCF0171324.1 hypothetical protein [Fusobacterium varium]MCF2673227.1 hypothetical protein [Fusobacterium varium]
MKERTFTFKFRGERADELAERFMAYFWDGGLDQTIEQGYLEEYGLDLDDVEFEEDGYVVSIDTSKAK